MAIWPYCNTGINSMLLYRYWIAATCASHLQSISIACNRYCNTGIPRYSTRVPTTCSSSFGTAPVFFTGIGVATQDLQHIIRYAAIQYNTVCHIAILQYCNIEQYNCIIVHRVHCVHVYVFSILCNGIAITLLEYRYRYAYRYTCRLEYCNTRVPRGNIKNKLFLIFPLACTVYVLE